MLNLFEKVGKDDLVIDCGAYIGDISQYFLDKGAKVLSIEPSPILSSKLRLRFKKGKVAVINKAAYDKNCDIKLFYHQDYKKADKSHKIKYLQGSSICASKKNVGKGFFTTEAIDLSNFIGKMGDKVKLLKLNVEGAEYRILDRLIDTGVIYNIENVVVSFHNRSIESLQNAHVLLKQKAIKAGVYGTIIHWKWWDNNRNFLTKIRKEYV